MVSLFLSKILKFVPKSLGIVTTYFIECKNLISVIFLFLIFGICILIGRQRRTHLNPSQPQPQPAPKRRKPRNHWIMPWILQIQEKGCYSNLLADLIHTDIPGYQNFARMPTAFFDLIEECIHYCIKKSVTNIRKPLNIGLKLAITLRHLATVETYTPLQYHWLVGQTTICKFVIQVYRAILAEFQDEYFCCPCSPAEWKRVEEKFRTTWNVPHTVGVIERNHIAMKKPKKSGSNCYNYKGFFSLVLLALINDRIQIPVERLWVKWFLL